MSARAPARVGADLVHVPGLAERLERSPGLAATLFSARERERAAASRAPARALARAFAVKEAFLKALGRGLNPSGPDGWLPEIEAVEGPGRETGLTLGAAPARALTRRGLEASVAVTSAGDHALAAVVLAPRARTAPGSDRA